MNRVKSIFSRLGRLLRRLRPRSTAHREISIAGPDQSSVSQVVGALLNATKKGANVLHSDDPLAAQLRRLAPAENVDVSWRSFEALYMAAGRAGRSRRWRFHLPASTTPEPDQGNSEWKVLSDVMILDWALPRAGQSATDALDDIFSLNGRLSEARNRGRLRRAAIVVSGIPSHLAPRDTSQVRFDLRPRESFQAGLTRLLEEGQNRCGHPLADPDWRDFLRQRVLGSSSLERLYENTRVSLGRAAPIFLLPAQPPRGEDATELLSWIATERTPSYGRRARLVGALNLAAGLLLALLLSLQVALSRAGRPVGEVLFAQADSAVTSGDGIVAPLDSLAAALRIRAAHHGQAPLGWMQEQLALTGEQERLGAAAAQLDLLAVRLGEQTGIDHQQRQFYAWRDSLRTQVAADHSQISENAEAFRRGDAGSRITGLSALLGRRAQWRELAPSLAIPPDSLLTADTSLEALVMASVLSSLRFVLQTEDHPDCIAADPTLLERGIALLDGQGFGETLSYLQKLRNPVPFVKFYRSFRQSLVEPAAQSRALTSSLAACVSLLPGVPCADILKDIRNRSLRDIAANPSRIRGRLADIRRAGRIEIAGRRFVSQSDAVAADHLKGAIDEALKARPMTILVSASEAAWHLHAASSVDGPFADFELESGDSPQCVMNLTLQPFCSVYVKYCGTTSRAFVVDETERCDSGKPAHAVYLGAQSRVVTMEGRQFTFEVASGWPSWPPQD